MQVSLTERDAEIIRLNLCLGDEKKRNNEMVSTKPSSLDLPLQMPGNGNNTPKRCLSRSSSRLSIIPAPS